MLRNARLLNSRRTVVLHAAILIGFSLSCTGCTRRALEELLDNVFWDIGRPNLELSHRDLRLSVDGSGRGTSVNVYFRNSSDSTLDFTITTSAVPRVRIQPVVAGDSRVRSSRTPSGEERLTITLQGRNSESVGVRVIALSVGLIEEAADDLFITSARHRTVFPVWIEPSEGQWRRDVNLGIVAVHAALMRDGQHASVLLFSPPRIRNTDGSFRVDTSGNGGGFEWGFGHIHSVEIQTWDLATNRISPRPMECDRNIFCSGHAHMPDGTLLIAGGHIRQAPGNEEGFGVGFIACREGENVATRLHLYGSFGGWRLLADRMLNDRWYPTVTTMADGRMLITSGSSGTLTDHPWNAGITHYYDWQRKDYELFDPATNRLVTPRPGNNFITADNPETYPGVYVLPAIDARAPSVIFAHERNRGWLFSYAASDPQPIRSMLREFVMQATVGNRSYPHYGSSVLLPLDAQSRSARVLLTGGQGETNTDHRDQNPFQTATATAEIFDFRAGEFIERQPGFRPIAPMNVARFLHDTTLLPDGQVLVTGGAMRGWTNVNSGDVLRAELFDPQTETFRLVANAQFGRRYHSTALLLPDGTVMKAGSTGGFGAQRETVPVFIAERYYPPYLWRNTRPRIVSISGPGDHLRYASTIGVTVESRDLAWAKFALIKLGSVTHGNNMDQRLVWLPIVSRTRGSNNQVTFTLTTPRDGSIAPPGDYMLFVLDSFEVPSLARFVNLR